MNQFDDAKNNGELHPSALVDGKFPFVFVLTLHYFKNYAFQVDLSVLLGLCNLITNEMKAASSSYKISSRICVLDLKRQPLKLKGLVTKIKLVSKIPHCRKIYFKC